jgi:hypothetical protein
VTSNLALDRQKADDSQGESGMPSDSEKARKFFVVKIFTSKSFVVKILRRFFAKPAPVKPFRRVGGGGYTLEPKFFPK